MSTPRMRPVRRQEVTLFRQKMERHAGGFKARWHRSERLGRTRTVLTDKYASLARLTADRQLSILLIALAHALSIGLSSWLAALITGHFFANILPAGTPGWLPQLLIPSALIGASLYAIHCYRLPAQDHPVVPHKREFATGDIVRAVAITVLFLALLIFLYFEARKLGQRYEELTVVANYIVIAASLEFTLGFKAMDGWALGYFHLRDAQLDWVQRLVGRQVDKRALLTARNADFFIEAEYLLALQEDREPVFRLSPAVKEALAYHQERIREER